MKFIFEERDEGLFVSEEGGRGVAHVETRTISENNDPRFKHPEITVTELPREKWRIHFTGRKFTPAEVSAFMAALETHS
jgi:hypothetical protein